MMLTSTRYIFLLMPLSLFGLVFSGVLSLGFQENLLWWDLSTLVVILRGGAYFGVLCCLIAMNILLSFKQVAVVLRGAPSGLLSHLCNGYETSPLMDLELTTSTDSEDLIVFWVDLMGFLGQDFFLYFNLIGLGFLSCGLGVFIRQRRTRLKRGGWVVRQLRK